MRLFLFAVLAGFLALIGAAAAETLTFGTAEEARAMLDRAVAALKEDKAKALEKFNAGSDGFRYRDLYVSCADADGKVTAHPDPALIGVDRNTLVDVNGKAFGAEIQKVAEEGKVAEVTYMYVRPGNGNTPRPKVAYVTKVADQVCLVGYYLQQ